MAAIKRRAYEEPGEAEDTHAGALQNKKSHVLFQTDRSRAAQYVQHVRALNAQFTSWVQQQLKEHPDELWQEGLQDYLQHASTILVDFKDVAGTFKSLTNTRPESPVVTCAQSVGGCLSDRNGGSGSTVPETSLALKDSNLAYCQPLSPSIASALSTSVSPGVGLFAQLPVLTIPGQVSAAIQVSADIGHDGQEDGDASNEPRSPSLKRREEPGVKMVYEIKCKLYIKGDTSTDKAWKDMGVGNLILKCKEGVGRGTKEAKATIIVRNDVGRILLNALLYPNIKMNVQKNTVTGIFHSAETENGLQGGKGEDSETSKARLYLFKLKSASEAETLVETITVNAPAGE